jgi:GNAT superfamily N-acetyltransferase
VRSARGGADAALVVSLALPWQAPKVMHRSGRSRLVRAVDVALTRELRQAVLRPHLDVAQMTASEPPGAFAVGAFDGDRLVAVGLIGIDGGERWRIRGMATDPSDRGRGAGGMVLDALIAHARAHEATRIWCNARVPARRSYERSSAEG